MILIMFPGLDQHLGVREQRIILVATAFGVFLSLLLSSGYGLDSIYKVSVILLSFFIVAFYYHDWASPVTKCIREKSKRKWSDDGKEFGIVLRNEGDSNSVFRVGVRIDGQKPIESGEFANSLFAQIPISSPYSDSGIYPKRTDIAKYDYRSFTNEPRGLTEKEIEENHSSYTEKRFEFPQEREETFDIMNLPVDGSSHTVEFQVQQTGKTYVFKYESDESNITSIYTPGDLTGGVINGPRTYGGRSIAGLILAIKEKILTTIGILGRSNNG